MASPGSLAPAGTHILFGSVRNCGFTVSINVLCEQFTLEGRCDKALGLPVDQVSHTDGPCRCQRASPSSSPQHLLGSAPHTGHTVGEAALNRCCKDDNQRQADCPHFGDGETLVKEKFANLHRRRGYLTGHLDLSQVCVSWPGSLLFAGLTKW